MVEGFELKLNIDMVKQIEDRIEKELTWSVEAR
jgi:hypothetical protein